MNLIQLLSVIIGSIVSLGALIAGAGYGYGQFYKGRNQKTLDDTTLFTARLDALKKICDDQARQIETLQNDIKYHTQEIGRLKGINEEKEKKINELNDLLSNRDPQLTEFIKSSSQELKDIKLLLKKN